MDKEGNFSTKLNQWEHLLIEHEMKQEGFVGWLRNFDRKPWALSLPYEHLGQTKPMYPDFLVIRKEQGNFVVDILEPHGDQFNDNYAKAKVSSPV